MLAREPQAQSPAPQDGRASFLGLGSGGGGNHSAITGEPNPLATTFCESDAIAVVVIYGKKFWGAGWLHYSVLRGVPAAAPAGGSLSSAWRSGAHGFSSEKTERFHMFLCSFEAESATPPLPTSE